MRRTERRLTGVLYRYRLNLEFHLEWDGRYYRVQQIASVVDEEADRIVVMTVCLYLLFLRREAICEDRV
ncbi:MAG: hypothetical protein OJF50_005160 [Nitrospira sp.]|nr:hypothetical protein [Nitrospira sp.]